MIMMEQELKKMSKMDNGELFSYLKEVLMVKDDMSIDADVITTSKFGIILKNIRVFDIKKYVSNNSKPLSFACNHGAINNPYNFRIFIDNHFDDILSFWNHLGLYGYITRGHDDKCFRELYDYGLDPVITKMPSFFGLLIGKNIDSDKMFIGSDDAINKDLIDKLMSDIKLSRWHNYDYVEAQRKIWKRDSKLEAILEYEI
jgi:hypothetical protein